MSYFKKKKHRRPTSVETVEQYLNRGGTVDRVSNNESSFVTEEDLTYFYESAAWKFKRREIYNTHPKECNYCGSTASLCVDHIRPVRYFWPNRLDSDNLQILCELCNRKKGNKIINQKVMLAAKEARKLN